MEKTLGGDRLGSGKKMKVDMHGYERSTHDMSYVWRSTMSPGTIIPFIDEIGLPGDTLDITLQAYCNTHPALGPLFGSFKAQFDVFITPLRLFNSYLHNNKLGIGRNMSVIKLPQIELEALPIDPTELPNIDIDNCQINPSCILRYLGISGIGINTGEEEEVRQFNITSLLNYWDVYKNYFSNKQEEIGGVIHTPSEPLGTEPDEIRIKTTLTAGIIVPEAPATPATILTNQWDYIQISYNGAAPAPIPAQIFIQVEGLGWMSVEELGLTPTIPAAGTMRLVWNFSKWGSRIVTQWRMATAQDGYYGSPTVQMFPLDDIDQMREALLATPGNVQFLLNTNDLEPYKYLFQAPSGTPNILKTQEGLGVKTYQSDLFNNWLKTEWVDDINDASAVDVTGGSFNIETLVISKKVYELLNRIAVSGGSFNDWQDAVWAHDRNRLPESPIYVGGLSKEVIFQEVVSNTSADADGGTQPLGTLAGRGTLSQKHKGGDIVIRVDEPSIILGVVSLTPRIDYSQGNKWHVHLKTMDDLFKPQMAQIGFQELITEQMHWADTSWDSVNNEWVQKSAGKQPAWLNYMTNVNKTYGNFAVANNEMFMTLNRRYEADETGILDLTTYIDPTKYNFIFANTALDAQNFWMQIGVDMIARRKMSAKLMPNL